MFYDKVVRFKNSMAVLRFRRFEEDLQRVVRDPPTLVAQGCRENYLEIDNFLGQIGGPA